MSQEPLRLGFIGAGRHARAMLYPSLHFVPTVRLTAIATQSQESAARAERDFRVRAYAGCEKLLADAEVDAVVISVPGGIATEIEAFAECILTGQPPLSTLEDAAQTDALRRAVDESAKTGKPVGLS